MAAGKQRGRQVRGGPGLWAAGAGWAGHCPVVAPQALQAGMKQDIGTQPTAPARNRL